MRLGKIIGKVWATKKEAALQGIRLYVMQPFNHDRQPAGNPVIAVDTVGAGAGETVFWVGGADATFVLPGRQIPSDVSIVGIVDTLQVEPDRS